MNCQYIFRRRYFRRQGAGAAILGIALCVPIAMHAQQTTPPQTSEGVAVPRTDAQTAMPYRSPRPPRPRRQLRHLTRMLNLTPDQQKQILPILRQRDKQAEALRKDTSLGPRQRHRQMRALMQDTHQKMEAVMTADQKQQFEQRMREMQQRMRDRRMQQNNGQAPPAGQAPPPPGSNGQPPPPQR